jgi:hypothetical protein
MYGKNMNRKIWIDRFGNELEIKAMSSESFHNLIYYFFIELQTYNLQLFNFHLPVIIQELYRRQVSVTQVMKEGVKVYTDAQGVPRRWDRKTDKEMAIN